MDNSSDVGNEPCCQAVSIVFTTLLAIISLAAFIGNILVMTVVYKTPSLRTSTNYYYVNMAVSDFLSSLTLWPLYLPDEIIGTLRLATTDYRRLDGRLLGLGRDKGFSPEPPSWL